MNTFRFIEVEAARGVQTITLNRPEKRNALSPELIDELTQVLEDTSRCDCGVVILTGAGSAFCAGLDMEHLETMNARTVEQHRRDSENMARVLRTLYEFPKPVIAAVNGPAIAGGMGLATLCDFTYAVPDARFGYTEVRVGFVPAIVASFLLPRTPSEWAHTQSGRGASPRPGYPDHATGRSACRGACPGTELASQQPAGHARGERTARSALRRPA